MTIEDKLHIIRLVLSTLIVYLHENDADPRLFELLQQLNKTVDEV